MIVAEQKPLALIDQLTKEYKKILIVGCSGCTTVCSTGGEREAEILASALKIKRRLEKKPAEVFHSTITRQCDPEFLEELADKVKEVECLVSLACGVGPQYLAERFKEKPVIPATDTLFAGGSKGPGIWEEQCAMCGDCILHLTGGICPITRCPKSIMNGPCGGSQNGKCEIRSDLPCVWQLIYERMEMLGKKDLLRQLLPPKDWSKARDGGPRRMTREDLMTL